MLPHETCKAQLPATPCRKAAAEMIEYGAIIRSQLHVTCILRRFVLSVIGSYSTPITPQSFFRPQTSTCRSAIINTWQPCRYADLKILRADLYADNNGFRNKSGPSLAVWAPNAHSVVTRVRIASDCFAYKVDWLL